MSRNYKDSNVVNFVNEDIVITDPCFMKDERKSVGGIMPMADDDWEASDYGSKLSILGFSEYITHDTLIGDDSWMIYDAHEYNQEVYGVIGVDSGRFGVYKLKDILAYNPNYDIAAACKMELATLLKGFTGSVQVVVEGEEAVIVGNGNIDFESRLLYDNREEYEYEEDCYDEDDDEYEDDED